MDNAFTSLFLIEKHVLGQVGCLTLAPEEPSEGVVLETGGQHTLVLQGHLLHSVSEIWGHELGAVSLQ